MEKMKSLTKNSIYYILYNVFNLLFPLLTGIYVARVLLASDIGEITYAGNIAQYFVILSCLGIPTYGMREIAKVRDNKEELNRVFSELFIINFVSTCICCIAFLILVFSVGQFREKINVFLIMGSLILCNAMNITWMFQGVEEFRFISIRNIVSKVIIFCCLVFFVRSQDDYLVYAIINVTGTVAIYLISLIYAPKHVKIVTKGLCFSRHIKPVVALVTVNIAIEIYSLVDVTMLGNIALKENVTFYTYGHRIQQILLQIINSFTIVIVPRLSNYFAKKEADKYNALISQTLVVIMLLSLPMIIGLEFISRDLLCLLYGERFVRAANVLMILAPLLIISPIGYLLGSRVMLVTGHETKMPLCVGIGAVVNVIGNALLIPAYSEYGAATASIFSEIVVMIVYLFFSRGKYVVSDIKSSIWKMIIGLISITLFLALVSLLSIPAIMKLAVEIIGAVVLYFGVLYLLKESTVLRYSIQFKRKMKTMFIRR